MNITPFTIVKNNYINWQKQIIFQVILFDMFLCHFHGGCPTYGQLCLRNDHAGLTAKLQPNIFCFVNIIKCDLKKSHHPFEHGLKDKQLNAASYCCFFLRDLFYKRHPSAICASKRHRRAIYTLNCLSTSLCTVKRVSVLMVHSSAALQLGDIFDRIFIF